MQKILSTLLAMAALAVAPMAAHAGADPIARGMAARANIEAQWASVDVSKRLVPSSTAAAAANAAVIQAAINAAQANVDGNVTVSINLPGTYYFNQVVLPSNTTLQIGRGVTYKKPPAYFASMFINYGALQGTPSVDSNITITGAGTIDGNAALNLASLTRAQVAVGTINTFLWGIQGDIAMIGVNNFTLSGVHTYACNGFVLQWIGDGLRVENVTTNTGRDFIHINGPSSHIVIENVTGYASDAFIALNAWDWHRSGPTVGLISDVRIKNVAYYGSNNVDGASARTSGLIIFLPGTRSTGYGQGVGNIKNVTLDGFVYDTTKGSVSGAAAAIQVQMTKDTLDGGEYSGVGAVDNVKLSHGYVNIANSLINGLSLVGSGLTADDQGVVSIRDFVLENIQYDVSGTGANVNTASNIYNSWFVDGLVFRNSVWTPNSTAGGQSFLNWANKTPADSIIIDGLTINPNTLSGQAQVVLINQYSGGNAATVRDLTMDRIRTAPGYTHVSPWLTLSGVVTNFRSRGNYIVGSGAGSDFQGIYLASATAQLVSGVVSDCYFNGTKELLTVASGVASAANLSVQNCVLNNVTHPIFHSAANTAEVNFRGSSINTGGNLARLTSASGTLKLSFVDTVSSGAGAAVITAAAAGVVQVRNSDRIQLPAGITATNPPTPANNDIVNFAATPSYTGSNVISGTGAGLYVYRGTGTVGWIKLN